MDWSAGDELSGLQRGASLPPPGWHDDPNDPSSLRYWDGSAWTEHRAPKRVEGADSSAGRSTGRWNVARIAAIAGAAAVVVGSVAPWATVTTALGTININGTEGDGVLTLLGGAFVALAVVFRWWAGAIVVGLLITAILLWDVTDVSRTIAGANTGFASTSVGWGLWVSTIGSIISLVAVIITRALSRRADDEAASTT